MNFFHKYLFTIVSILLIPFAIGAMDESKHPFAYDLNLSVLPGEKSEIMVCCHGMGGDWRIAEGIKQSTKIEETLISFNFPDHGIRPGFDPLKTHFGTIEEILPLIYVLKRSVIDENRNAINLYGFSAGGGAIINALAFLNSTKQDNALQGIGIYEAEKKKILEAIQRGTVLLDAPLKSIEEIVNFRGPSVELEVLAKRYEQNKMEPIEVLKELGNLSLNIIVNFQNPDEILSNRDDFLYIERLQKSNQNGTTKYLISKDGGHVPLHPSLWKAYFEKSTNLSGYSGLTSGITTIEG